jgi:hypothetical protein
MKMSSARIAGVVLVVMGAVLTQWAFRFGMAPTPVDAFVRLLVLVADVLVLVPSIGSTSFQQKYF